MGQIHQELLEPKTLLEPHLLIFPVPLQGAVNCCLKLAELLCLSGIRITFLNVDHIHRYLVQKTQVLTRFDRYPNFQFETIPDGVDHERPLMGYEFDEVMESVNVVTKPLFQEMMVSGRFSQKSERPVTVMILDPFFTFTVEVGIETSTPVICFQTGSACCLWTSYFSFPALVEAGDFPFKGEDLDELVTSVPGTQHVLRKRDLASFCRYDDLSHPEIQVIMKEVELFPKTQGLILNTFEELDDLVLPHMRKICPNIYPIGPFHSLHKDRLMIKEVKTSETNSFWKENRTCLSWLDKYPPKSVIYVSMGSLATMTFDQMLEIWHGLVNSKKPFLWVRRPGSIMGGYDESRVPSELLEGTNEMGCIVDWGPQEDILAHQAIGGFFTHSGWNSTMESIVEGVPMICWPYYYDQQVNSRFVEEVWKVGIDMKDTCDRFIIEKAVRELMDTKQDVFTQSADKWANLAKKSITETGSSSLNLARLIDDIKSVSLTMK